MYYGRKKGIIIAIVAVVVVIILALVGVILVSKTDLFKSNKTLFWKYAGNMTEENGNLTTTQLQDITKMMEQTPYTIKGDLTLGSDNSDMDEILNLMKLDVETEADKQNDYSHANLVWEMGNEALINLDLVKSEKIFALKSDEIVTMYLGLRNENLKVLAQKLGVTDTSLMPDEITLEETDYSELFNLSEQELQHIKDTYGNIILGSIPETNYSKQTSAVIEKNGSSYTTTSYRLDLSGQELKEIEVRILEELKTDSITLNLIASKAKLLGVKEDQIDVEKIANYIDDLITQMDSVTFDDVSFVVYNYKGKNIATEMIVKNVQKITIYKDTNNVTFKIEDLTGDANYDSLNLSIDYTLTSTQTNIVFTFSKDNEELFNASCSNIGSASQGSLTSEITANISLDDQNIQATYNQELTFVDELENVQKLDETNCAILNDLTQEQLLGLIQAISDRIQVVAVEKGQILSNVFANQSALDRAQNNTNSDVDPLEDSENEQTQENLQPSTNGSTGTQNSSMQISQPGL